MSKYKIASTSVFIVAFFIAAASSMAQIRISEIMYNPAGINKQRTWIEVINDSKDDIDITTYGIVDSSDSKHRIEGPSVLSAGEIAIIAKDPAVFASEYSLYKGGVYKSALDLRSGHNRTLSLLTPSLATSDEVIYSSNNGAYGDGDSLHITADGTIYASTPSPGALFSGFREDNTNIGVRRTPSRHISQAPSLPAYVSPFLDIPPIIFSSVEYQYAVKEGVEGEVTTAVSFWNFGDGATSEENVPAHSYQAAGTYRLVAVTRGGEELTQDVVVVDPDIPILSVSKGEQNTTKIVFENNHEVDIDISHWWVSNGVDKYVFSKGTYLGVANKQGNTTFVVPLSYIPGTTFFLKAPKSKTISTFIDNQYSNELPASPVSDNEVTNNTSAPEVEVTNELNITETNTKKLLFTIILLLILFASVFVFSIRRKTK